ACRGCGPAGSGPALAGVGFTSAAGAPGSGCEEGADCSQAGKDAIEGWGRAKEQVTVPLVLPRELSPCRLVGEQARACPEVEGGWPHVLGEFARPAFVVVPRHLPEFGCPHRGSHHLIAEQPGHVVVVPAQACKWRPLRRVQMPDDCSVNDEELLD